MRDCSHKSPGSTDKLPGLEVEAVSDAMALYLLGGLQNPLCGFNMNQNGEGDSVSDTEW